MRARTVADGIDLMRPLLDAALLTPLVEYVAERLDLQSGHRRVVFEFERGDLRRTRLGHEPIGNVELESLAEVVVKRL